MRFYLISDNLDTWMGMRMSGIEGTVVHEKEEVEAALREVCSQEDIGVVLISSKLIQLCRSTVYDLKLTLTKPLIVEVSDRHGEGRVSDSITQYVREAVGIKI